MSKCAINAKRVDEFSIRPNDPSVDVRVITNPDHPEYDDRVERPVDLDMVASFRISGQIQAARGYKAAEKSEGGKDVVVLTAGRGRWKAMNELWRQLEAEGVAENDMPSFRLSVYKYTTEIRKVEDAIIENVHRDAVEPVSLARKLQDYLNRVGDSTETRQHACTVFRIKSLVAMKNLLSLLDAVPAVQQAVAEGKLNATAASLVSRMPVEKQEEFIAKETNASAPPTVSQTREKISELTGKGKPAAIPTRREIEKRLDAENEWVEKTTTLLAERGQDAKNRKEYEEKLIERQGFVRCLRWILEGGDK